MVSLLCCSEGKEAAASCTECSVGVSIVLLLPLLLLLLPAALLPQLVEFYLSLAVTVHCETVCRVWVCDHGGRCCGGCGSTEI